MNFGDIYRCGRMRVRYDRKERQVEIECIFNREKEEESAMKRVMEERERER